MNEKNESAHRSPDDGPTTSVWLVKTPEGDDAVIVSFVDADNEDPTGIWLYEPGVDPAELHGVTVSGVANEFEYATVTTHQAVPCHRGTDVEVVDQDYPGDVMVTSAQRDAALAGAVEAHEELESSYAALHAQTTRLLTEVRDSHELFHGGTFPFCGETVCEAARDVVL